MKRIEVESSLKPIASAFTTLFIHGLTENTPNSMTLMKLLIIIYVTQTPFRPQGSPFRSQATPHTIVNNYVY